MKARMAAWLKWLFESAAGPVRTTVPAAAPPAEQGAEQGAEGSVDDEQEPSEQDELLAEVWRGGFEAGQRLALTLEAERQEAAVPAELAAIKRALAPYCSVPPGRVFGTRAEEYAVERNLDLDIRTRPAQAPGLNGSG